MNVAADMDALANGRRQMTPQFVKAVLSGLRAAGQRDDLLISTSKVLWSNTRIVVVNNVTKRYEEIENRHYQGAEVNKVRNTVVRMFKELRK